MFFTRLEIASYSFSRKIQLKTAIYEKIILQRKTILSRDSSICAIFSPCLSHCVPALNIQAVKPCGGCPGTEYCGRKFPKLAAPAKVAGSCPPEKPAGNCCASNAAWPV